MKMFTPNFTPAVVAALVLATHGDASAQAPTTATTDPVGFLTSSIPASDGTTRVSRTLCFPLYKAAVFSSAATEVVGSTCRLNGADFATTNVLATPHLLRVKSSATSSHVGQFFAITGSAGDQLTLSAAVAGAIGVGDGCEVLPANTLASVFGTGATLVPGWLGGASANSADKVFIWNATTGTWDVYFYHTGNSRWQESPGTGSRNNTIIYPDEGVFISRLGTTPVSLTALGTIPTTAERTDLNGGGSTCIANRFPVDTTLLGTNLQATPGWVKGNSASASDNVYIWNGAASTWDVFFYHQTSDRWQQSGAIGSRNSTPIAAGTAMFVKRVGPTASTFAQSLPYNLNP